MAWDGWDGGAAHEADPELDWLFPGELELQETAKLLHQVPHPEPPLNPAFRMALRHKLVEEASERARPAQPWWQRLLLAPRGMALAGAAVGVLLIGLLVWSLTVAPPTAKNQVTVSSPLQGAHQVAATKPIQIQFSQPMNTSSVEDSIQIQPATRVRSYDWSNGDRTVAVVPEGALAPSTLYQVTVGPQARAKTGQAVPHQAAVSFVTAPAPNPQPSPTPSTSPLPSQLPGIGTPRRLGPWGSGLPLWSPNGSTLYVIGPGGQLQGYQVAGGGASQIASGVTADGVATDGTVAYVAGGQVVSGGVSAPASQITAIGFQDGGRLLALSGHQVQSLAGSALAALTGAPALAEEPTAAEFSPGGRRLAYLGASGQLHVLDLASGQDAVAGPASGLGSWSRDGSRYAYPTSTGVFVTGGGAGSRLLSLPGANSVAWSGGQVLATTASGLWLANADGIGARELQSGSFSHPTWSPAGNGTFAYVQGGQVFVASVNAASQGTTSSTGGGTNAGDLVNRFMAARQGAGDPTAFLDANGRQAFSNLTLNYGADMRWSVRDEGPGRAVVRIVPGNGQGAIDETLRIVDAGSGNLLIDGATDRPETPPPSSSPTP
jgi:Bacterial Ig-like domain